MDIYFNIIIKKGTETIVKYAKAMAMPVRLKVAFPRRFLKP